MSSPKNPSKLEIELPEKMVDVGRICENTSCFPHFGFGAFFGTVFGAVFGTVFGTVFGSLHRAMVLDNRRELRWLRPMPIYTVVGFELGLATIGSGQDEAWPFMGRRRSAW